MNKHEARAKLRATIQSAIQDARWNGLTLEEIRDILRGESVI